VAALTRDRDVEVEVSAARGGVGVAESVGVLSTSPMGDGRPVTVAVVRSPPSLRLPHAATMCSLPSREGYGRLRGDVVM